VYTSAGALKDSLKYIHRIIQNDAKPADLARLWLRHRDATAITLWWGVRLGDMQDAARTGSIRVRIKLQLVAKTFEQVRFY
jgi:hypothetical protein